ncbi:histidine kinase [Marinobacter lipolyticus]|uniref:ATP-binding protein n=1 Tax=Marinobacter lipolyticus TaxID=209639 RepID=UPI001BCC9D9F|nr:ATP-binding protein [Marinobacter lipolyticus]MBS8240501.1 histidine kinase [Marinobacter lipolyticus]
MNLKRQLFLASLLMLLIPWAGLQFVLELDEALRTQAAEQVQEQARRMAQTTGDLLIGTDVVEQGTPVIYAQPVDQPPRLDGYGDDWPGYDEELSHQQWQALPATTENSALRWQAVTDQRHLYLLVRVQRPDITYFDPGSPARLHDRLRLIQQTNGEVSERLIRTPAPGSLYASIPGQDDEPDYRVTGRWETVEQGYQLELQLPLPPRGSRLGLVAEWPQDGGYGSAGTELDPPPVVVRRLPAVERELASQLAGGQHLQVVEPDGWVIARQTLASRNRRPEFDTLSPLQVVEQIALNGLRALVRFYQPEPQPVDNTANLLDPHTLPQQGLVRHRDGETLLMVTQPVFNGRTLVLEQSLNQLLALSGNALGSVIARSTLLVVALMLILLGYVSWLSWRITRLQRAVSASVDDDGRIVGTLPPTRARDELGQLHQHFGQMVNRLHGYNDYLESFSRRLSHELKTPVAVVRSSLDNLRHADSAQDRDSYIARAASATDRLSQILNGMSEAARLEQSFDHAEKEHFDLAEVLAQATRAYQELDRTHRISYQGPPAGAPMNGSPELIVQLLDKLVDNARDFTPADGRIQVTLAVSARWLDLSVFNEGSQLPDRPGSDIFAPFISHRNRSQDGHLGQGLLIVRLITEHHGGRVRADNDTDGVRFTVSLPRQS